MYDLAEAREAGITSSGPMLSTCELMHIFSTSMGCLVNVSSAFIVDFCNNIPEPWGSLKQNIHENHPKNGERHDGIHHCQENQAEEGFCLELHVQKSPLGSVDGFRERHRTQNAKPLSEFRNNLSRNLRPKCRKNAILIIGSIANMGIVSP